MTVSTLNDAVAEAKRFLAQVQALHTILPRITSAHDTVDRSPEAAAVRRASLDLTKALTRLRKL